MSARVVVPLRAPATVGLFAGTPPDIPAWLHDDVIVKRAIEAKRTHPPSRDFWECLAKLAQLSIVLIEQPVGRGDLYVLAVALVDDLAVELDQTCNQTPGPDWEQPASARQDPSRPGQNRGDDRRNPPWAPSASGERATPRHARRYESALTQLVADTANLAASLADPCVPRLSDLSTMIDSFGVALRGVLRHGACRPPP